MYTISCNEILFVFLLTYTHLCDIIHPQKNKHLFIFLQKGSDGYGRKNRRKLRGMRGSPAGRSHGVFSRRTAVLPGLRAEFTDGGGNISGDSSGRIPEKRKNLRRNSGKTVIFQRKKENLKK
jgi:hypothetical protein